jgi:hypothetical protein
LLLLALLAMVILALVRLGLGESRSAKHGDRGGGNE